MISSSIGLIYSTLFLQSILCLIGPTGEACCCPMPCQLTFMRRSKSVRKKSTDSVRRLSNATRRHQRVSTSSYLASSYFSQILTGSTYFESEYGGINELLAMVSRRRESSRSYQINYALKRASIHTGDVLELYTPRTSLAPHYPRYSRHSSVSRGVPTRLLYISPSVSPHSQLSIHSQANNNIRARSPSPRSLARLSTAADVSPSLLRPCHSVPRLHRTATKTDGLSNKTLTTTTIHRQQAINSNENLQQNETLTAADRRNLLKSISKTNESRTWLKRSNSS